MRNTCEKGLERRNNHNHAMFTQYIFATYMGAERPSRTQKDLDYVHCSMCLQSRKEVLVYCMCSQPVLSLSSLKIYMYIMLKYLPGPAMLTHKYIPQMFQQQHRDIFFVSNLVPYFSVDTTLTTYIDLIVFCCMEL